MSHATATPAGPSGLFATSRRGGLTAHEITVAEELRNGPRPVSWQHIAARTGRCAADWQAYFARQPAEPMPPVWPAPPLPEKRIWTKEQIATLMRFERREISLKTAALSLKCHQGAVVEWQASRVARGVAA